MAAKILVICDRHNQSFLGRESNMILKRQNLRDKFSTFLSFSGEKNSKITAWSPKAELRKNIDIVIASKNYGEADDEDIALYFVQALRSQNSRISQVSRWHLVAYLQETCFFTCQVLLKKFDKKEILLEEIFQVANIVICEEKFFANYDPNQGKLSTYVSSAIKYKILDFLSGDKSNARSVWGELYQMSATRFREENLVSIKFSARRQKEDYVYIHSFFQKVCCPSGTNKRREKPSEDQLQAISDLYNNSLKNTDKNFVEMTPNIASQMLDNCIEVIRKSFMQPKSLDAPIKGNREDAVSSTLLDTLKSSNVEDIDEENEMPEEKEAIRQEMTQIIRKKLDSLDIRKKGQFILFSGFGCTSTQVANLYQVAQTTVSRLYDPFVEICLELRKKVSKSTDEVALIKDLRNQLKIYIKSTCQKSLYEVIDSFVTNELKNISGYSLNELSKLERQSEQLAQQCNQSTEHIDGEKERLKGAITEFMINYLRTDFEILALLYPVTPKIDKFIDKWMSDHITN